ncbi:class I SAM-dependent methyltransferase [Streptomyces sp. GESEQ-35]|uniref:class I SAM-dependent methyltransferase n=1 Tax=Streptomyces sp. GESEQ-35 TaxID=2812657 RepID=UPI001B322C38|nr:class I SAM-dependent methyltransferase [Streptomyces sp. GESEQ-35]
MIGQSVGECREDSGVQRIRDRVEQSLVDWVGAQGIRPQAVLDVGGGTGTLLRRVGLRFPDAGLTGVDVSPHGPAERLPFEDETFDLVVSTVCCHHRRSPDKGLAEIGRVLRPGGRFCIAEHYAAGWLRPFFAVPGNSDRGHTREELTRRYGAAGLKVDRWQLLDRLAGLPFSHGIGAVKP